MEPQQMTLEMTYITPNDRTLVKLAQEFATAQYGLTPNEIKAWILFIASIDKPVTEGVDSIYVFDALSFADKLGIDKRKARGKVVADLFIRLSRNSLDMRSREDDRGEQDIFHSNFISTVDYRKDTYRLEVGIPTKLRPYLFALKQGTFNNLDVQDILALDTVASMRIYIYLKDMERVGKFTILIEELRKATGFTQPYYDDFRKLKHKVLLPAVREICKHTQFKHFFIEDNGGRGRKATHLHFGFDKEFDSDELFLDTSHEVQKMITEKFSPSVQLVIRIAMDYGFKPRYIEDKLDQYPDDIITANFNYVIEVIRKEKRQGKEKDPDIYGRYFIKAVQENWALKNDAFDKMKEKGKKREKNEQIQKQMKEAQERDDMANLTEYYRKKAIEYVAEMDFTALNDFINKNKSALDVLAGKRPFDYEHAISRKKNYREYKFLIQTVLGQMVAGQIKL